MMITSAKNQRNILLTFDYELFLGKRSGSVQKCLIEPTHALLEVLKQNAAKALFFIDTTYLAQLEKVAQTHMNAKNDFTKIIKQLQLIVKEGHYVFHHLHPHWIDAKYNNVSNEWNLENTSRYALFNIKEQERQDLFKYSHYFLSEIYKSVGVQQCPNGFRAGGLFIEPFYCFKPYFEKYNIRYDFSVVPGEKKEGDQLFYDFSSCVYNQPYPFENNLNAHEEIGKYIEFPISKIEIKWISKILNSFYYRALNLGPLSQPYGDGVPVCDTINKNKIQKKAIDYIKIEMPLSVEMLNPLVNHLLQKKLSKQNYIHFLSHPKLLTYNSLKSLNAFLSSSKKRYEVQFDFKGMYNSQSFVC